MADRNLSIYPAAQCAAFWLGYGDYARLSAYLDHDPTDAHRAHAFRQVAVRLGTASAAEIDDYIATQRPLMVTLMDGVVYRADRTSQEVFERLAETCKSFAQEHPETRDLS